jgi:hypothetical protein
MDLKRSATSRQNDFEMQVNAGSPFEIAWGVNLTPRARMPGKSIRIRNASTNGPFVLNFFTLEPFLDEVGPVTRFEHALLFNF